MMKKDWEIKKQNLEGRTPSTCEAGVSPLQTTPLPQHALKAGWEIKKLGEVCEFLDSRRKPITANKRTKGPIPYYGATGILDYVADFLFDEELILLGEDGAKWGPGDKSA
ncbi:MAG: restriction endonuclease subunit S, partial [Treponema sp.]|nr:restriction endonuclease subunit S [Treponema sp.]